MKIQFQNAKVVAGAIGKQNALTATIAVEFTPILAEAMGCREELFSHDGQPRRFSYHGLRLAIEEAKVLFQGNHKERAREFDCQASHFEVDQSKKGFDAPGEAMLRFKLSFDAKEKIEAFALLFAEAESPVFYKIVVEGAQQEFEFESQGAEAVHA